MNQFYIFRFGPYMDILGPFDSWVAAESLYYLQLLQFPQHTFYAMNPLTEPPWTMISPPSPSPSATETAP